jgi:hypothetical protein
MNSSMFRVWKGRPKYQYYPHLHSTPLLADVIAEASKDGSKERWLELPTDQGYGATCVPASIDE